MANKSIKVPERFTRAKYHRLFKKASTLNLLEMRRDAQYRNLDLIPYPLEIQNLIRVEIEAAFEKRKKEIAKLKL